MSIQKPIRQTAPSPLSLSRRERGFNTYRGRFAPSPTGELHFGSLVAALASWLRARQQRGEWLLRVEDIDPPREVPGSAESILATLTKLGLAADGSTLYQSWRGDAYAAALARLRDAGHAFPCWCSRADLEASGTLHRDGRCITPRRDDRAPAWRLRVPDLDIVFDDILQGPQRQNVHETIGDFVLLRADGLWSYQLACVVDDAFQGITEVVRGCDLLDSTPRQILLQRLLDLPTPDYLHLPLAVDAAGCKLSKSNDAPAIDADAAHAALSRALRFLGQSIPDSADATTLLRKAAIAFNLDPLRGMHAHAIE
ncbi:MAG TPA: tRNA glutamyl-Q(34) synthetase GluQRS [Rhodanobacteraceae bacterium]